MSGRPSSRGGPEGLWEPRLVLEEVRGQEEDDVKEEVEVTNRNILHLGFKFPNRGPTTEYCMLKDPFKDGERVILVQT